jgi:toxin ParE1/3/4
VRLALSRFVEADLEAIGDTIAQGNPRRAISFIQQIRQQFGRIERQPLGARLRPEIGPDARLVAFGRYVILYRLSGDVVRIERVVHGRRDLPARLDPD